MLLLSLTCRNSDIVNTSNNWRARDVKPGRLAQSHADVSSPKGLYKVGEVSVGI